ncbi:MAG TPA: agmatine deiminase family protein [Prolixibacteraceae bacterium]|nr:agmatine deiminase family protein [Prolixibacteraceae bacterium]
MNTLYRRFPAEWEKHQATLLSFPSEGRDWPGKYHAIKWAFVEIIKKVTAYEPVVLVVNSDELRGKVAVMLEQAHVDPSQVSYIIKDTNRNWMRDSGPAIVKTLSGGREAIQFGFTGWAKYKNHRKDQGIPAAVADHLGIPLVQAMYNNKLVVLEGGSIDVNGTGTLITTEECLMDPVQQIRNKGFKKQDYENIFREYLGVTNTIWLGEGIEGDDTHGHVDDICRFVNRNTVVAVREPLVSDPNHKKLEANISILENAKLEDGTKLNVVPMPMPARLDFEDLRLPASYVNFLVTNGYVLVPTFNDKNDYKALGIMTDLFPGRDVIGINAVDLVWGLGTLHCLSHEIAE